MSDKLDITIEHFRAGLTTAIIVKEHDYDAVEFTLKRHLAENGKEIVNSHMTSFFSMRELENFLQPLVNKLNDRINYAKSDE